MQESTECRRGYSVDFGRCAVGLLSEKCDRLGGRTWHNVNERSGLFYRLKSSRKWLQHVLGQLISKGTGVQFQRLKLRIVDATVITGPAATGTDWRVHAIANPQTGVF